MSKDVAPFIPPETGLCAAADIAGERLADFAEAISGIEGVPSCVFSAKVLGDLSLKEANRQLAEVVPDKNVFYNHKRAGSGGRETADEFAEWVGDAGIAAVLVYPPMMHEGSTEQVKYWLSAVHRRGVRAVMGIEPTSWRHVPAEGGYTPDRLLKSIVTTAIDGGVRDFWVRAAGKPERVPAYRNLLDRQLGRGNYSFLVAKLGKAAATEDAQLSIEDGWQPIEEMQFHLGDGWQAVAGSVIHQAPTISEMASRAERLANQLLSGNSQN